MTKIIDQIELDAMRHLCEVAERYAHDKDSSIHGLKSAVDRLLELRKLQAKTATPPLLSDLKPAPIYAITVLNPDEDLAHATFGFFYYKEDAFRAVDENRCDMHECLYTYLVVEEIRPGIQVLPTQEFWFQWNFQTSHWDPTSKPDAYQGSVGFFA